MLVRNVGLKGQQKISDRWQHKVYTDQPNPDIPVFVVRHKDGTGRCKTLHRNLLLPISVAVEEEPDTVETTATPTKRITRITRKTTLPSDSSSADSDATDSEETRTDAESDAPFIPFDHSTTRGLEPERQIVAPAPVVPPPQDHTEQDPTTKEPGDRYVLAQEYDPDILCHWRRTWRQEFNLGLRVARRMLSQ